jgi:hypothetical protein
MTAAAAAARPAAATRHPALAPSCIFALFAGWYHMTVDFRLFVVSSVDFQVFVVLHSCFFGLNSWFLGNAFLVSWFLGFLVSTSIG